MDCLVTWDRLVHFHGLQPAHLEELMSTRTELIGLNKERDISFGDFESSEH